MEALLTKGLEETNGTAVFTAPEFPTLERSSGANDKILLEVLSRVKNGDFSARMPVDESGRFRTMKPAQRRLWKTF